MGELDLLLDTRLIAAGLAPDAAGGLIANAPIPDDLEPGEYTLRLVDPAGPTVVAERVIVIGQQAALPSALLPLAAIVGLLFLLIVALVRGARKRQTVAGGSGNALAASAPIAALPAPAAMNVEAAAAPVAAITTEAYIEPEIAPVAFAAAGRGPWSRRAFTTEPNEQVVLRDVATWAGRVWAAGAVIGEHGSHMALWASDDGVMWGEPQLLSPGSAVRILADGSDLYVVGEGARAEHGEPSVSLWHSQDAETWLDLARSAGTRPTGLVTDAVISAALPIIACRTAEASEVWTRFDAGWMRSSFPGTVSALGQIGERLVGLGTYRASAEPMAIELLADGVWHEATIEAPPEFDSFVATDMVTFHGQLVAVGSSATGDAPGVWVSHDGARWRPGTPPPAEGSALRGAAVVAGQLIVFGGNSTWFGPVLRQSATVWSSSDVHEWESLAEGAMFDDSLAIAGAAAGDRLYLAGDIGGDSATTSHTHTAAVWIREFAPRSAVGLDARVSSLGRPTIGKPL